MRMSRRLALRFAGGLSESDFTYTGTYTFEQDGSDFLLKLLTSGTLTLTKNIDVDMFLCGGGGNGGTSAQYSGAGGGGGGYVTNAYAQTLAKGTHAVVVGGSNGSTTVDSGAANALSAAKGNAGGNGNANNTGGSGGNGGSGGGAGRYRNPGGAGGTNGANGQTTGGDAAVGKGSGVTTKPFGGDIDVAYSAGGSGGSGYAWAYGASGAVNTGNGGGGGSNEYHTNCTGGAGGSGIIIIRNKGAAA